MNVTFFGSDYYSGVVLQDILSHYRNQLNVTSVVTNINKTKLPFEYQSVSEIANSFNIPQIQISHTRDFTELFKPSNSFAPMGLVASFGYLIPTTVIQQFSHGIINLHPAPLPKYRGPTPVQTAIINGETQTAITIMSINDRFDQGPIISQIPVTIESHDTTRDLLEKLFLLGTKALANLVNQYPLGNFPSLPQNQVGASQTHLFSADDARVNWGSPHQQIDRTIRAFYPQPIAWTTVADLIEGLSGKQSPPKWQNKRVLLHASHLESGQLSVDQLQIAGKNIIRWNEFAAGYLN